MTNGQPRINVWDEVDGQMTEDRRNAAKLEAIREEIREYHLMLDLGKSYVTARMNVYARIARIMDMKYEKGAEKARRDQIDPSPGFSGGPER